MLIDRRKQTFWFGNNPRGAVKPVNSANKCAPAPISVLESVVMPPRCACHLVAQCPWENPLPDVPVCFEGSADLQERTLLNMAQGRHRAGKGRSSNVTSTVQAISSQNSILSREQHTKSMALIISFSSIFAKISFDIELARLLKHDIDVGDAKPIFQRQYWIPHAYKPIVTEQMNRLQEADIISTRQ